jgi:hypothetical protein
VQTEWDILEGLICQNKLPTATTTCVVYPGPASQHYKAQGSPQSQMIITDLLFPV